MTILLPYYSYIISILLPLVNNYYYNIIAILFQYHTILLPLVYNYYYNIFLLLQLINNYY